MTTPTPTWTADLKAARLQIIDARLADGTLTADDAAKAKAALTTDSG